MVTGKNLTLLLATYIYLEYPLHRGIIAHLMSDLFKS